MATLTHIPDEHVDNIYTLSKFMFKFLDSYNITYWAIGGTLIGTLRNHPPGPIRWDDDVDIGMLDMDNEKLVYAMQFDDEFNEIVEFAPHDFGYQFRLKNDTVGYKDFYLDIFVYKKQMGKNGYKYYSGLDGPVWEDFYYNNVNEILPVKRHRFWDFWIYVPALLSTVHRGYGMNVIKYGEVYNHIDDNGVTSDLTSNLNSCNLVPMLSAKLLRKLEFRR